jgi:AcrR family transcriptional regulator
MKRKPTEVRQAEIVEAAMQIIASKGAKSFTAQLIADEVGMTAGGIFRHFASMEEIVERIIDRMEDVLFDRFPPTADDPWHRLHEFFQRRIQAIAEHPDVSSMLLSDHLTHLGGERAAARVKELKQRSRDFISQCLQDAADSGAMAEDVSVNAATIIVLGSVFAVGHSTTHVADETVTKKLIAEVWRVIDKMQNVSGPNGRNEKGACPP